MRRRLRDIFFKCQEDWQRGRLSVVTLLALLSLFLSQACLLSALTFRRPCLRETRCPKCHSRIYSCERWLVEQREGVRCGEYIKRGRGQINLEYLLAPPPPPFSFMTFISFFLMFKSTPLRCEIMLSFRYLKMKNRFSSFTFIFLVFVYAYLI